MSCTKSHKCAPQFLKSGSLARPLLIFTASRIFSSLLVLYFVRFFTQDNTGRIGQSSGDFFSGVMTWDAVWYGEIASTGYPDTLPTNEAGEAVASAWAFYPLWPMICRFVMSLTGQPFYLVAALLAPILGAAFSCVFYRLLKRLGLSEKSSLICLAALVFSPVGVIFSLAYAEALSLLLIVVFLSLFQANRYWLSLLPIGLLAFTRPITVSIALTMLILIAVRLVQNANGTKSFPMKERLIMAGIAVYAGLAFGVWPIIVGLKLGSLDAYVKVQSAWQMFSTESIFFWLISRPSDNWQVSLIMVTIIGLSALSILQRNSGSFVWPGLMRAWALGYLIFVVLIVPAGYDRPISSQEDIIFYPSIFRYMLLTLLPALPLAMPWRRGGSALRLFSALAVTCLFVALTLLYYRYFLVMEGASTVFWL